MAGFAKARLGHLSAALSRRIDAGELPGAVTLLSRGSEIHVEALGTFGFGDAEPMRRDTIFRIASMTKPIVAAAIMMLVEECKLRLDDSIEDVIPELSNRRVLRSIDAQPDDTVPALRPITLRDLLTFRFGFGLILAPPGAYPIQQVIVDKGFAPRPGMSPWPADEWIKRLAELPLLYQPGERFLYHTGSDIQGLVIERVSGKSLGEFLKERIFDPLGMKDTGFWVPPEKMDRLATGYFRDPAKNETVLFDDPKSSAWSKPPVFELGGGGLVSTADDYLAFLQMMLGKGVFGEARLLSRPTVEAMISPQLTAAQVAAEPFIFGEALNWGFGMAVTTHRTCTFETPGRFGWDGAYGCSSRADPAEGLIGILMTQRGLDTIVPTGVFADFWQGVYQAIDD